MKDEVQMQTVAPLAEMGAKEGFESPELEAYVDAAFNRKAFQANSPYTLITRKQRLQADLVLLILATTSYLYQCMPNAKWTSPCQCSWTLMGALLLSTLLLGTTRSREQSAEDILPMFVQHKNPQNGLLEWVVVDSEGAALG